MALRLQCRAAQATLISLRAMSNHRKVQIFLVCMAWTILLYLPYAHYMHFRHVLLLPPCPRMFGASVSTDVRGKDMGGCSCVLTLLHARFATVTTPLPSEDPDVRATSSPPDVKMETMPPPVSPESLITVAASSCQVCILVCKWGRA